MTPRGAPWRGALAEPSSSLASVGAHSVIHKRHRWGGVSGLDAPGCSHAAGRQGAGEADRAKRRTAERPSFESREQILCVLNFRLPPTDLSAYAPVTACILDTRTGRRT